MPSLPQPTPPSSVNPDIAPEDTVSGSVESIIFRNETTGYSVLSVRSATSASETIPVVGPCAAVWVGEELVARGNWTVHPAHGRQFVAQSITCVAPTSTEGIRRYLASGIVKGIAKVNAQRIVERFGMDTLRIIEKESKRLEEVEGIGPVRRRRIKDSWDEQRGVRDIMIFLQSHGVGTAQAARIYRQYGPDAIAIVKQNPYRLCEEVWGIGFKSADAIAARIGIPPDSRARARAGLHYLLGELSDEGHCFALEPELLLHAEALLGISVEKLADAMNADLADGTLLREADRIYLPALHDAECRVADQIRTLLRTPVRFRPIRAAPAVEWAEAQMRVRLAEAQRQALMTSLTAKVSIITGGPGVGKTTIIRALTEVFRARRLTVLLAAPTGRAAKRMSEATGHDAQTIHRLLKFNPQHRAFEHNAEQPLRADGIILDETSMIDIHLMDHFLRAVPPTACLVMVGDTDQLPSVGPGAVLKDFIASGTVPCQALTDIFRQDATGLIVRNAHRVNAGEMPFNGQGAKSDFFFIDGGSPDQMIERTVELVAKRIPRRFGFNPLQDIQVLTPMRRNQLGAENLNHVLQKALNPHGPALQRFGVAYRQGDRVMQIRNNYDKDIFNGDIGWIDTVEPEEQSLTVTFDGRPVEYELAELDELVHAYACSIHKSQGSEYPAVVVLIATQHFKLLQRNLLYTAITRGRELVCLLGTRKAVAMAVKNQTVQERRTTLSQRLAGSPAPPA